MADKEEKRREVQRKVRDFVVDLQKQGKSKEEIKTLKAKRKRELESDGRGGARKAPYNGTGRGGPAERGGRGGFGSGKSWRQEQFGGRDARNRGGGGFGARGGNDRFAPRGGGRGGGFGARGGSERFGGGRAGREEPDYSQYETREEAEKAQKRDEMARKHDLVIIPILWKRREEEAQMVKDAAQDLKNKLMKHRVNAWIDQRSSLLPGQKYEYWESMGVKFRMELGPQEATTSTVCLSKAESGQMAERWKDMSVAIDDFHELLKILRDQGLKWVKADEDPCDACAALREEEANKPEPVAKPAFAAATGANAEPKGKHIQFSDDEEDDRGESASVEDAAPAATAAAVLASGDSLESNWA